jgi:hypothetical protein
MSTPSPVEWLVYCVSPTETCFYERLEDGVSNHMRSFLVNVVGDQNAPTRIQLGHPMHDYVDAIELTAEGRNSLWEKERLAYKTSKRSRKRR